MSRLHLRPHFDDRFEESIDSIEGKIVSYFKENRPDFQVLSFPGYITLRIPEEARHFWSPQLNLHLLDESESTQVEGVYGPNTNVWAMFLYGYLFFGSVLLFGLVMGISQLVLDKTAWGCWGIVIGAIGSLGIYIAGRIGKRIGTRQTMRLHKEYQSAVGREIAIR